MTSDLRYSDVSQTYNTHVANLDRARLIFQREVEQLNEYASKHIEDRRSWPLEGVQKVRWGKPEHWSTARETTWLNWTSATRVRLDVRPPGYMRYKMAAAYVFFQTSYDQELAKFVFSCRLENQNAVSSDIDEEAIALIRAADIGRFPNAVHVKRNRAMLFRINLEDSLYDEINDWVDRGFELISATIDRMFPDAEYLDNPELAPDDDSGEGED
jgi:hypothetical protein